ncbi:MAG: hypothetical protein HYX73_10495 [Acidobacteria bacterium]|nr:hypothetical protein [Acidobacteriota bacterium]
MDIVVGEGAIRKSAAQRIVIENNGPVDSQSRVNGDLDVFLANVAPAGPSRLSRIGSGCVGAVDSSASADAASALASQYR